MLNDKIHEACSACGYFPGREALNVATKLSQILMPAFKTALKNKSKKVQQLISTKDPQISSELDCTLLTYT